MGVNNKNKKNNKQKNNNEIETKSKVLNTEKKIVPKCTNSNVTLAGFCAICWTPAKYYCPECRLVGYCCLAHMANHWLSHQELCTVANRKIKENQGCLFGSNIDNGDDWRYARMITLKSIKSILNRDLEAYERDLLLFPKYCYTCYETRFDKLVKCNDCHQVWYCRNKLDHIPKSHPEWCKKLQLFWTLVRSQAEGRLYMFDMNFGKLNLDNMQLNTNDNIAKAIRSVLNNHDLDDCKIAMISQSASGPLTMLYALKLASYKVKKSLTIHLIGAELHYEGNTLQAWETFFMHFLQAELFHLKIIMIGPELKASSTLENIRVCDDCNSRNKSITIQYEDKLLYHTYAKSKKFIKPDIVCAFNPGLHRSTGFNQTDTWPQTIQSAVANRCPFIFTAYTAYEAPLDLQRVTESASIHVVHPTIQNRFASLKPDRNFISDHEAPLIFKNYYLNIVTAT